MDVGDEICWWQLLDVGDCFGHFGPNLPVSLYITVGHQYSKDVTKIFLKTDVLRRFRLGRRPKILQKTSTLERNRPSPYS